MSDINVKENVSQYGKDILEQGTYSNVDSLAIQLAGQRINDALFNAYSIKDKKVLDIGCGDGRASIDYLNYGAIYVKGYEPCKEAVDAANNIAIEKGLTDKLSFEVGNIYSLNITDSIYDVAVLRSIIHHLPDPQRAFYALAPFTEKILIMEPNGFNPFLKAIERLSSYHRAHQEQSFTLWKIKKWMANAGFAIRTFTYVNLVPVLCPDWFARVCKFFEPGVEKIPVLKQICCGQVIIYAEKVSQRSP